MMKAFLALALLAVSVGTLGQAKITGTVKNLHDSAFYISETGGFHNLTRAWRDNRVKILVDKNNRFAAVIPEAAIGTWYIKTEQGIQLFDVIKGQTLEIIADFSQRNPLLATGRNSVDFNYATYLNTALTKFRTDNNFSEKIRKTDLDSVLSHRKELADLKIRMLSEYRSRHQISDTYYHWLLSQYTYEPFERTLVENIKKRDSLDDVTIAKIMEKGINDNYAALNTGEYNDLVDFYVSSLFNRTHTPTASLSERFLFIADSNILTGNTRDVYLSRFMAWMIKTPDSIYIPLFEKYDVIVKNEQMKEQVINRRNDYKNPVTSAAVISGQAGSIAGLLKQYKGKIVYVDFWASWCVPCRNEMPNAAALKQKLKDKQIIFLYLGYNDKEPAWLKARDQLGIEGEHYLLTDKMVKDADDLFGINGIPHYAIIGKEGQIIARRADRPSEVYNRLLNLLKK